MTKFGVVMPSPSLCLTKLLSIKRCDLSMDTSIVKRLEDVPWYHSSLTRNGCEVLLLANGSQGSYLIRPSQSCQGQYTVSVRSHDSVKHFSLTFDGKKFIFGAGIFPSIQHLIEHFENLPILAGETGLPITLKHPYPSKVAEPSVYDTISRHAVCGSFSNTGSSLGPDADMHIDWAVASKEGFLTKQGAIRKNWKRRWFVTTRHTLQYYNERGDTKPLRVLDLCLAMKMFVNSSCIRPNAFSIVFPKRTLTMSADSEQELEEWMELLEWKLTRIKEKSRTIPVPV